MGSEEPDRRHPTGDNWWTVDHILPLELHLPA
jgi:hypothetical protein